MFSGFLLFYFSTCLWAHFIFLSCLFELVALFTTGAFLDVAMVLGSWRSVLFGFFTAYWYGL
jgi:hypothetical protein